MKKKPKKNSYNMVMIFFYKIYKAILNGGYIGYWYTVKKPSYNQICLYVICL